MKETRRTVKLCADGERLPDRSNGQHNHTTASGCRQSGTPSGRSGRPAPQHNGQRRRGLPVVSWARPAHGAADRHRHATGRTGTRRQIVTGANPSGGMERKGGRLRRVSGDCGAGLQSGQHHHGGKIGTGGAPVRLAFRGVKIPPITTAHPCRPCFYWVFCFHTENRGAKSAVANGGGLSVRLMAGDGCNSPASTLRQGQRLKAG